MKTEFHTRQSVLRYFLIVVAILGIVIGFKYPAIGRTDHGLKPGDGSDLSEVGNRPQRPAPDIPLQAVAEDSGLATDELLSESTRAFLSNLSQQSDERLIGFLVANPSLALGIYCDSEKDLGSLRLYSIVIQACAQSAAVERELAAKFSELPSSLKGLSAAFTLQSALSGEGDVLDRWCTPVATGRAASSADRTLAQIEQIALNPDSPEEIRAEALAAALRYNLLELDQLPADSFRMNGAANDVVMNEMGNQIRHGSITPERIAQVLEAVATIDEDSQRPYGYTMKLLTAASKKGGSQAAIASIQQGQWDTGNKNLLDTLVYAVVYSDPGAIVDFLPTMQAGVVKESVIRAVVSATATDPSTALGWLELSTDEQWKGSIRNKLDDLQR